MTESQKLEIQVLVNHHCGQFKSQSQAVAALKGVSEATVIHIRNNKWDSISDSMWINVGNQVGWQERKNELVETQAFTTILLYYITAKENGATFALTGGAGYGKTFTGKWYRNSMRGKNVYYLECAGFWNKKYFLIELMREMGRNPDGMNVYEMMDDVVSSLRKQHTPLIILDEIDKLDDKVLQFFITFYNSLNKLCGIVWTSTDAIEKKISNGLRLRKPGYNEIFSRIGRKYIQIPSTNLDEVKEICGTNGINDQLDVQRIYNEYEGDLRRIDREFLKEKVKASRRTRKHA